LSPVIPIAVYLASVLGAVAVYLLMPSPGERDKPVMITGGLLGAAALGGVWLAAGASLPKVLGLAFDAYLFQYVFSFIAIGAAVRVITHTRPVYSALWLVLVVISSAGLFLTLSAQFMAFAMVIIYAGAILVTYMFVLMLASHAPNDDEDDPALPFYDRDARDPLMAVTAGFLLLAVLLTVGFEQHLANPDAAVDVAAAAQTLPDRTSVVIAEKLADSPTGAQALPDPTGLELLGLDLFENHPLGLELAGIVLLVALIGAVMIARTQLPDEGEGVAPDHTGATVTPDAEPDPTSAQSQGQYAPPAG